VISKDGIFGSGLNVRYDNVEVVEVDGLEGDDEFFVISTPFGVATRVIGNLGSDTVNVMGDVSEDIITRELEGVSGVINHRVESEDEDYDGLPAPGIDLNVASPQEGVVIIKELDPAGNEDNFSVVREGGFTDRYSVRLGAQPAPGTKVYITISARGPRRWRRIDVHSRGGPSTTATTTASRTSATRSSSTSATLPRRACSSTRFGQRRHRGRTQPDARLVFDSTNWQTEQTVHILGVDDELPEGRRVVTINHAVAAEIVTPATTPEGTAAQQQTLAIFDRVAVRNVEVTVIDDDQAGLLLTESDNTTIVLEGDALMGLSDTCT
jgi:hypothetical protein